MPLGGGFTFDSFLLTMTLLIWGFKLLISLVSLSKKKKKGANVENLYWIDPRGKRFIEKPKTGHVFVSRSRICNLFPKCRLQFWNSNVDQLVYSGTILEISYPKTLSHYEKCQSWFLYPYKDDSYLLPIELAKRTNVFESNLLGH